MAKKEGYNLEQKPGETMVQYYRRLAKTADQRLVRIEKYQDEKYFKVMKQWAYARAQTDIRKWAKGAKTDGKLRFNTKPPEGEDLIAKINDIKSFLSAPTSTKAGVIEIYKKRADTVNSKYGTSFNWKQLAKYYDSGQAEKWELKFGSKTALRTIAVLQKKKPQVLKAIEEADKKDIRVPAENAVIAQTVQKALADNSLNIKDLL